MVNPALVELREAVEREPDNAKDLVRSALDPDLIEAATMADLDYLLRFTVDLDQIRDWVGTAAIEVPWRLWKRLPSLPAATVVDVAPQLTTAPRHALMTALSLQPEVDHEAALARLLEAELQRDTIERPTSGVLGALAEPGRSPARVLDAVLGLVGAPGWTGAAGSALLTWELGGALDPLVDHPRIVESIAMPVDSLLGRLGTTLDRVGFPDALDDETYRADRDDTTPILFTLALVDMEAVVGFLRELLVHPDPGVAASAVVALAGRDDGPDVAHALDRVLADPEWRTTVRTLLDQRGHGELVPRQHRTIPALAEEGLVGWLMHPNEYGRAPKVIERLGVVPVEVEGEQGACFVYRFLPCATGAPTPAWTIGLSGPWPIGPDSTLSPSLRSRLTAATRTEEESETLEDAIDAVMEWCDGVFRTETASRRIGAIAPGLAGLVIDAPGRRRFGRRGRGD